MTLDMPSARLLLDSRQENMRVLVTGATGFLGRKVTWALLQRGMEVRCLVHTPGREDVLGDAQVDISYGDVTDVAALKASMYHVDAVVHLAAIIQEDRGMTFEEVNVLGTRNIAAVSRERGVEHLVHASVTSVRNNRRYRFLHSRWLAEQEVIRSGLPYTIVRFSTLFGPGDEFVNTLNAMLLISPIFPLPGLSESRFQPMAVEDAARCIAEAVGDEGLIEKTVELGGPESMGCREMVELVCRLRGLRRLKVPIPFTLLRKFLQAVEATGLSVPVTTHRLDALTFDRIDETSTVEKLFGFQPTHVADGIQYVGEMSRWDAWRVLLGITPKHIRDH